MNKPLEAVRGLIARVAGEEVARAIRLSLIEAEDGRDTFETDAEDGVVTIRGSSASALAAGFNWYLKYDCQCHVSFCGSRICLPDPLPLPEKRRVVSPYQWHYIFNGCEYGYTMTYWDWEEWECRLDWVAMQGINAAFCPLGQEAVWHRLLTEFGYTEKEADDFIVGPSFMLWFLVSNISGWGGPLPQSWYSQRLALARRVMDRMEELGIAVVLMGYAGMVPEDFAQKNPGARVVPQGTWCGMPRPAMLDMTDPLFARVADRFYALQREILGDRGHLYLAELFAEGGIEEGMDIPAGAAALQERMLAHDPEAIWVVSAWWGKPDYNILSRVRRDRCLVIDLFCECTTSWQASEGYWGTPWVWGVILNFGGRIDLNGNLTLIAREPLAARADPKGRGMAGIGHVPEGMETNPVAWELLGEMYWRSEAPDLYEWLAAYATRRYGGRWPQALGAWQKLLHSVYNGWDFQDGGLVSIYCVRPSPRPALTWGPKGVNYDAAMVRHAARLLLDCLRLYGPGGKRYHGSVASNVDALAYDVVDVTRQALGDRARELLAAVFDAFARRDVDAFRRAAKVFLALGEDEEELLAARREFLLGPRIAQARAWGTTGAEKDLYEFNLRTILTLWGDRQGAETLHDYANKEWAGMLGSFYLPRWRRYIAALEEALLAGQQAPELDWYDWEYAWTVAHDAYPVEPAGDVAEIAAQLQRKYLEPDVATLLREAGAS